MSSTTTTTNPLPSKIGIVLFPGFQLLDAAGPLDAFNLLANQHTLSLCILAPTLSPVSPQHWLLDAQNSHFAPAIVPTHTFADAPKDLDMLLVPGGMGSRDDKFAKEMEAVVAFLKGLDLSGQGSIKHVLTVCTGSEILARTGLLNGREATTNKRAFNEVKAKHPGVNWVAKARWVVDGNIWTSSGVSAGMDLAFAWIREVWGEEVASYVADRSEVSLDSFAVSVLVVTDCICDCSMRGIRTVRMIGMLSGGALFEGWRWDGV